MPAPGYIVLIAVDIYNLFTALRPVREGALVTRIAAMTSHNGRVTTQYYEGVISTLPRIVTRSYESVLPIW